MEIGELQSGHIVVLVPKGRLDTTSSAEFELVTQDQLSTGALHLIIDLSELAYVSSSGLQVFVNLAGTLKARGSLRLCNASKSVLDVFEMAGSAKLFEFFESRQAALASHPQREKDSHSTDLVKVVEKIFGVSTVKQSNSSAKYLQTLVAKILSPSKNSLTKGKSGFFSRLFKGK